jgi:hypothetical protein
MSIACEVIVPWGATPEQLTAVGTALWRWCSRTSGPAGLYRYLDDQALADLIAGRHPGESRAPCPTDGRGVHVWLGDEVSRHRRAAVDRLRQEVPSRLVEDILVAGKSWDLSD